MKRSKQSSTDSTINTLVIEEMAKNRDVCIDLGSLRTIFALETTAKNAVRNIFGQSETQMIDTARKAIQRKIDLWRKKNTEKGMLTPQERAKVNNPKNSEGRSRFRGLRS